MAAECENFCLNCFYWLRGKWFYVEENWKIELYIDSVNKRHIIVKQFVKMMLNMGPNTHTVPLSMFKENLERVMSELKKENDVSYVLLQGGNSINLYNTDVEYVFRQEPFFMYFFGVRESDCYGVVNVQIGHATLFVPRLHDDYATWMGRLWTCNDFKNRYGVDDVKYADELSILI